MKNFWWDNKLLNNLHGPLAFYVPVQIHQAGSISNQ